MSSTIFLTFTFLVAFAVHLVLGVRKIRQGVGNHPGRTFVFSAANIFANFFPRVKYVTVGLNWGFLEKHDYFAQLGNDVLSITSLLPSPQVDLILADAGAIKEMTTSRARFPKPIEYYGVLQFFGRNIVVSEGEQWKKYRKISAPAFSDHNNKLVWDASMQITQDMMEQVWLNQDVIHVDHCVEYTLSLALFVIGVAGFGKQISWKDEAIPAGHKMTFKQALHIVMKDFIFKVLVPGWAFGLTKRLRLVRDSFSELRQYMKEMIIERQNEVTASRHDLFSNFLDANNEEGEALLDEDEILGNIFIFLVAGHETTAHTLCYAFALLALYPDVQGKLFQQVNALMPDGRVPTYEEMPKFTYSLAVFYESLRMFPPVNFIPKTTAEDTTLNTTTADGKPSIIPVPKGTFISIITPALHYNPRYWPNPHTFYPERFLGDWPRDAFAPFSAGARACIGRKFSETEGVAILSMLISKYEITIKEEPQFAYETFEQRKTRVLRTTQSFTLSPIRVPLTFTRRG